MSTIESASIGTLTKNTIDRSGFTLTAIISAPTSITGARNPIFISIKKEFCTIFTSVVRRVTSEAVENLSIFLNEKSCTLLKSLLLRFFEKPMLALAPR